MRPTLKWLAVAATIGMIILILGGALVTKTESGDGCGTSWPLCHDQLIPSEISKELIIEAAHRITTGVVAIIVTLLAIFSWKEIGHIRETKFLTILAIVFLIIQSLIGAATVIWGQSDFFLALHFGISLISFAAVFLLTVLIFEIDKKWLADKVHLERKMVFHTVGISIFSIIVIYSGALVQHTNAGLICADWPFCRNNDIGLPLNFYEWVQMGHRLLAALFFFWILIAMVAAIKNYKNQPVIYYGWIFAFILISLQIVSGAFIIFTDINLYISLLHALFITCLFGLLSYQLLLVKRSKDNQALKEYPQTTATKKMQAHLTS